MTLYSVLQELSKQNDLTYIPICLHYGSFFNKDLETLGEYTNYLSNNTLLLHILPGVIIQNH